MNDVLKLETKEADILADVLAAPQSKNKGGDS